MTDAEVLITPAQRRSNRIKLLIIWMVPLGLMAIAWLCFYLVQTGQMSIGSKNKGELLIPPLQMDEFVKPHNIVAGVESGQHSSLWEGKWSLVIRGDASCDQRCRDALYLSRQIHIRLNKDAGRVQRIYLYDVVDDANTALAEDFQNHIDQEHRLIKTVGIKANTLTAVDSVLIASNGEIASFFVVDPQGWAMMYYLDEHQGSDILQDLKHLLKFSRKQ